MMALTFRHAGNPFYFNALYLMIGAAEGTRTPDPIITNDVLYQLSYCGARSV
jgi:hypothetical protein